MKLLILSSQRTNFAFHLERELGGKFPSLRFADLQDLLQSPARHDPFLLILEIGEPADVPRALLAYDWVETVLPLAPVRFLVLVQKSFTLSDRIARLRKTELVQFPTPAKNFQFKVELQLKLLVSTPISGERSGFRAELVTRPDRPERVMALRGPAGKKGQWQEAPAGPGGKVRWRWVSEDSAKVAAPSEDTTALRWMAETKPIYEATLEAWVVDDAKSVVSCWKQDDELYRVSGDLLAQAERSAKVSPEEEGQVISRRGGASAEAEGGAQAGSEVSHTREIVVRTGAEKTLSSLNKETVGSAEAGAEYKKKSLSQGAEVSSKTAPEREGKGEESPEEREPPGVGPNTAARGGEEKAAELNEGGPPKAGSSPPKGMRLERLFAAAKAEVPNGQRPDPAARSEKEEATGKKSTSGLAPTGQFKKEAVLGESGEALGAKEKPAAQGGSHEEPRGPGAAASAVETSKAKAREENSSLAAPASARSEVTDLFQSREKARASAPEVASQPERVPEAAPAQTPSHAASRAAESVVLDSSREQSQEEKTSLSGEVEASSEKPAAVGAEGGSPEATVLAREKASREESTTIQGPGSGRQAAPEFLKGTEASAKDRDPASQRAQFILTLEELGDQNSAWEPAAIYRIYLAAHLRYRGFREPAELFPLWVYQGELAPSFLERGAWRFYDRRPERYARFEEVPPDLALVLKSFGTEEMARRMTKAAPAGVENELPTKGFGSKQATPDPGADTQGKGLWAAFVDAVKDAVKK